MLKRNHIGIKGDLPPSQPRILQLLPALGDGGVERSVVEMTGLLKDKGIENWVCSAGGALVPSVEANGAHHEVMPVGTKSPWKMITTAHRLARLIDDKGIDIVHARSRAPAWVALAAIRLSRRKPAYITTFHGLYSHKSRLKRFYNSGMLRCPIVIANSNFIRDHIIEVYSYPAEQIIVAPRGIEPAVFDPAILSPELREQARNQLGGEANRPLVTMVGRLTGWKGHSVLLEAMARARRRDFHLAFVGGGDADFVDALKGQAVALGLADRVTIAGSRRDIPAVLSASDLAISASTRPEAFGRAAIEAQAMEVPVVATDHGGSRETVIHGTTGWLISPGDPQAMADAIDEALSDPQRLAEMGRAGRAHVLAHFTTHGMLEKEYSAYERVLAAVR
jgi:glycosyltransferase involved in cell wall biosynthesis